MQNLLFSAREILPRISVQMFALKRFKVKWTLSIAKSREFRFSSVPVPKNSLSICGTRPNLILRFFWMNLNRFHAAFPNREGESFKAVEDSLMIQTHISRLSGERSGKLLALISDSQQLRKRIRRRVQFECSESLNVRWCHERLVEAGDCFYGSIELLLESGLHRGIGRQLLDLFQRGRNSMLAVVLRHEKVPLVCR